MPEKTSPAQPASASPRIAPVEPPYAEDVAAELARWMPPGSGVEPLALFRTLGRHLLLARAMRPLGSHLLSRELSFGRREREIVILRVCARCGCAYEWGVHAVVFGARAGLAPETIAATWRDAASAFDAGDALLVRLADELHDTGGVSAGLWTALRARWSEEQLLELLVLAGWYHVIAYVANGAGVALESWAQQPPLGAGAAAAAQQG